MSLKNKEFLSLFNKCQGKKHDYYLVDVFFHKQLESFYENTLNCRHGI